MEKVDKFSPQTTKCTMDTNNDNNNNTQRADSRMATDVTEDTITTTKQTQGVNSGDNDNGFVKNEGTGMERQPYRFLMTKRTPIQQVQDEGVPLRTTVNLTRTHTEGGPSRSSSTSTNIRPQNATLMFSEEIDTVVGIPTLGHLRQALENIKTLPDDVPLVFSPNSEGDTFLRPTFLLATTFYVPKAHHEEHSVQVDHTYDIAEIEGATNNPMVLRDFVLYISLT
jgi:hypothetical protein